MVLLSDLQLDDVRFSSRDVASVLVDDYVPMWSELEFPQVVPLAISSSNPVPIFQIVSDDSWESRLFHEAETFVDLAPPTLGSFLPPVMCPPFSRVRPVLQRCATRADGARCRDGAGVGSPLIVDPEFYSWKDPLKIVRDTILSFTESSDLGIHVGELAEFCAQQARGAVELGRATDLNAEIQRLQQILAKEVDALVPDVMAHLKALNPVEHVNLDFRVDEGQPFRLHLLSAFAFLCQDPDCSFPFRCMEGVILGDEEPLADCIHFPVKIPSESDQMGSDFVAWGSNYRSCEECAPVVRKMIQEDVDEGFAHGGFTWVALCRALGLPLDTPEPDPTEKSSQIAPGIATMRLGCVDESLYDDSGVLISEKYRIVCDGTASGVNGNCVLPVTVETPSLMDGECLFSVKVPGGEHFVGMKVDVKGAFKRVKLRPDQYRHAVFGFEGKWYYYVVLPFGMKASAFHWVRLNSVIHRVLKRLCQVYLHGSLLYIDDSLYCARDSQYQVVFPLILVFLRLLGVPISWKKLFAGVIIDWVGYRMDFVRQCVFLSGDRLGKLRLQMDRLLTLRRIPVTEFRQLVFRMVWACGCFPMARVFLHKFFAVLKSAPAKRGFIFSVLHLSPIFDLWFEMISAAESWQSAAVPKRATERVPLTRTDAMADENGIFIGGWHAESIDAFCAGNVQWFAFSLDSSVFPDVKQTANRMISSAEAIGVAIAIAAFKAQELGSDSNVTVLSASKKWYSPSANFAFAMTSLVRASAYHHVRPHLSHVAGKDNALADALSRVAVDPGARAELTWLPRGARVNSKVILDILPELKGFLKPLEWL